MRKLFAEFFGTFWLVFGGCGAAVFASSIPNVGIGLGSIVSSLELPVSVMMAYFLLNEQVLLIQWIGIVLIITAIVIMNIQFKKNK